MKLLSLFDLSSSKHTVAAFFVLLPLTTNAANPDGILSMRSDKSATQIHNIAGTDKELQIKPIFEADWVNTDGNQNQQAMAYANNHLYICINPYELPEHPLYGRTRPEGSLYIRCVDVAAGTYSSADDILIQPSQLPGDFRFAQPYLNGADSGQFTSYYTICADDNGQLIAALASVDFDKHAFRNLRIILYPVNVETKTLDLSGRIEISVAEAQEMGSAFVKEIWMERISDFKGSFKSGNFSFNTMVAAPNLPSTEKFAYKLLSVETTGGIPQVRQTLLQLNESTGNLKSCENPDIDFWEENSEQILLSSSNNNIPAVYYRNSGTATSYNFNQFWPNQAERNYCRGQFTFSIGGYSFMLAGTETTGNSAKASFRLFQLPEGFDENGNATLLGSLPDSGFNAHSDRYAYRLRQHYSACQGRDDDTKIVYAYSPGCGLAAYEVSLTDRGGVDNINADTGLEYEFDGKVLKLNSGMPSGSDVKIFDIAGRYIKVDVVAVESVNLLDFSNLPCGIYFVVLPNEKTLKICRKD